VPRPIEETLRLKSETSPAALRALRGSPPRRGDGGHGEAVTPRSFARPGTGRPDRLGGRGLDRSPEPGDLPQPSSTDHRVEILYGTTLDAMLVVDDRRRIQHVNRTGCHLLGAPAEEIVGRELGDLTPPESHALLDRLWEQFERRGVQEGPYEVLRPDGSRVLVEYRARRDFGPGEHLIAFRELVGVAHLQLPDGRVVGEERPELSPRQREVLQLAAEGLSTQEIADVLVLSPGTIKTHFQHIYEKLEARDRASAVAAALRHELID
jgi:PAS domain S-box-containing protein